MSDSAESLLVCQTVGTARALGLQSARFARSLGGRPLVGRGLRSPLSVHSCQARLISAPRVVGFQLFSISAFQLFV
jgi:hypothetical protein